MHLETVSFSLKQFGIFSKLKLNITVATLNITVISKYHGIINNVIND